MKEIKNIYIAALITCIGFTVFIFRESIPTVGGINIAQVLLAGAAGGAISAILLYYGILKQDKKLNIPIQGQQGEAIMETRNIFIRVLSAFGWLILIYFVTNFLIGATVGGIAGASTDTYEAGAIAGEKASIEFFQSYGLFILLGQILLFSLLAFMGKLPGTTKLKGNKST